MSTPDSPSIPENVSGAHLFPEHLADLRKSGLSDATIEELGFYSADQQRLKQLLGWQPHCTSGLVIPYPGEGDYVVIKAFPAYRDKDGHMRRYLRRKGQGNRLYVPPSCRAILPQIDIPLDFVEGEKKAACACQAGLFCAAISGLWNFLQSNGDILGLIKEIPYAGRLITLWPDSHVWARQDLLQAVYAFGMELKRLGGKVRVGVLPCQADNSEQKLDDFITAFGKNALLSLKYLPLTDPTFTHQKAWWPSWKARHHAKNGGPPPSPSPTITLPAIQANDRQLPEITTDALKAVLAQCQRAPQAPVLFVRGGLLHRIGSDEDGRPTMEVLAEAPLKGILARVARWEHVTYTLAGEQRDDVFPPIEVVRDFLSLSEWRGVPGLQGLVQAPTFGADGTLHQTLGYNPRTRLYHTSTVLLGDTTPTPEHIDRAKTFLLKTWWGDFPFQGAASQAHTLSLALCPFMREMIASPIPLTIFDSPTPGTGKGLLIDVIAIAAVGSSLPTMTAGKDPDEWRKRITSTLLKGRLLCCVDNIHGPLESGDFASVLTQPIWEDRVLGVSRNVTIPVKTIWMATGNNIVPSEEIARRSVWVRLDANCEKPWEREDFAIKQLRTWTFEHRSEIVTALITLIRAWIEAGKPAFEARRKGSYEAWAEIVGGVLQVCGVPGFLENEQEFFRAAVGENALLVEFVRAWWDLYKNADTGTDKLFKLASRPDEVVDEKEQNVWQDLLSELLGSGNERSRQIKLGHLLNKHKDKVIARWKIQKGTIIRGVSHYKLQEVLPSHASAQQQTTPPEDKNPPNGEQNSSGECGECGESSNSTLWEKTLTSETTESTDILLDIGGKDSPHSPHSPRPPKSKKSRAKKPKIEVLPSYDPGPLTYITDLRTAKREIAQILHVPVVGLDTETTGLSHRKDRVRLAQLSTPGKTLLIDLAKVPVSVLSPLLIGDRMLIGHNIKFDLKMLMAGNAPEPTAQLFDTQIAAQLLEASDIPPKNKQFSLTKVASRYLDLALPKELQKSAWGGDLSEAQLRYAAADASVLQPLMDVLAPKLSEANLDPIMRLETDCLLPLIWMEMSGASVNGEAWGHLADEVGALRPALEARLREVADINWRSWQQVAPVLQAHGIPVERTNKVVLEPFVGDPLVDLFLEWGEADDRESKFGSSWLRDHFDAETGRVYGEFQQLGSRAGRMSMTKPNLQQIPRKFGALYRQCFQASPGEVLLSADYSQIELRVLAYLSKDPVMTQAFLEGKNIHQETAAVLFKKRVEEIVKDSPEYDFAKMINFGVIYGMGAWGLARRAGISEVEAQKFLERYFRLYQGVARFKGAQLNAAIKHGEVRTILGRRRLLTRIRDRRDEQWWKVRNMTINSPVQGSAADAFKLAVTRLYQHRDKCPGFRIVNLIHDEIMGEGSDEQKQVARAWVERDMLAALEAMMPGFPVEVKVKAGSAWGQLQEI